MTETGTKPKYIFLTINHHTGLLHGTCFLIFDGATELPSLMWVLILVPVHGGQEVTEESSREINTGG